MCPSQNFRYKYPSDVSSISMKTCTCEIVALTLLTFVTKIYLFVLCHSCKNKPRQLSRKHLYKHFSSLLVSQRKVFPKWLINNYLTLLVDGKKGHVCLALSRQFSYSIIDGAVSRNQNVANGHTHIHVCIHTHTYVYIYIYHVQLILILIWYQ